MSEPVSASRRSASNAWTSRDVARWASQQVARRDLSDGAKLVLLAMAEHIRDERATCWPSIDRLAAMTGRSRNGTKNAIEALAEAGLVIIEARLDETGRSTSNLYRLAFDQGPELGPSQGSEVGPTRGQNLAPEVRTNFESVHGETTHARGTNLLTADPQDLLEVWNLHRGRLPEWRVISPLQAETARKRLKELPLERWVGIVQILAASAWCVSRQLGPSFLLRPDTWPRALNGEIAGWGKAPTNVTTPSGAQAVKRAIDASGADGRMLDGLVDWPDDDGSRGGVR